MSKTLTISIVSVLLWSCISSTNEPKDSAEKQPKIKSEHSTYYVNEYGSIELSYSNDTTVHVFFKTNDTLTWDTLFYRTNKRSIFDEEQIDGYELFQNKYSFLLLSPQKIKAIDISGIATLSMKTKIEKIYDRSFYRTDQSVTLYSSIHRSKGDYLIEGMYLSPNTHFEKEDTVFKGLIKKELYPRSYYSTPESPQGMFGDTTQKHYRLIFQINHQ